MLNEKLASFYVVGVIDVTFVVVLSAVVVVVVVVVVVFFLVVVFFVVFGWCNCCDSLLEGKRQSLRPLGGIIETNESPAFCETARRWRNAAHCSVEKCPPQSRAPLHNTVALLNVF